MSAGILWGGGDVITQVFIEKPEHFDFKRLASVGTYGTVIAGPLYLWWYAILDRRTSHFLTGPGGSVGKYIGAKIFGDQVIFEPFNLSLYFLATKSMEGVALRESVPEFIKQFPHLFLVDSAIWPLAQYINFRYLPLPYQALYVNAVSLGWAVILSFLTHREPHAPTAAAGAAATPATATVAVAVTPTLSSPTPPTQPTQLQTSLSPPLVAASATAQTTSSVAQPGSEPRRL